MIDIETGRIGELARRVKRGAKLLDKKIGDSWRKTICKYRDQFDFADGAHCVLGTLEHYNGRMRTLRQRGATTEEELTDTSLASFRRALRRLGLGNGETSRPGHFGFEGGEDDEAWSTSLNDDRRILTELWFAEAGIED